MASMRVHELAKELNISSKAITDMLSNADKKYTAMSGLGESEINSVRASLQKQLEIQLINQDLKRQKKNK